MSVRPLVALCVILSGLAARPMHAQAPGVPKLAFEQLSLPNGLTVILHEDHSTPIVAIDTWYHVGSADERPGRTGFAHLFEHIMFMGSAHVPVGDFDRLLESNGATNNGSTTVDRTNYTEQLPSNVLPLALWLDADRMGHLLPVMDQEKLDLQREVVKNERRERYENAPYGRAYETLMAALFPAEHPYHWTTIGSMADLTAASLADVREFFRTYYAPNNATLVIAGDFSRDSAVTWVTRYFGGIPRGPQMPPRPVVPSFAVPRDTFVVLEDKVTLPRLYEAFHTVKLFHPDDAVLDVLADVLAGDKNSRLYKRLVFELQVAQDVNAYQVSGRLDGYFQITVTPKPGQTPARMAALVEEEIGKIVRDGVTARELARSLNSRRASFLDGLASVAGKADQLANYDYSAGTPDYVQQDFARYERVTAADVQRVAASYLQKPKVVLTVVPDGQRQLMVRGGAR